MAGTSQHDTPVPDSPGFCPWCGSRAVFQGDRHTPLWRELADEQNVEVPEVVEQVLHTDAYVCGCANCKRVTHVIGHVADA